MGGRQEAVGEVLQAAGRNISGVQQHISGQVLVFAAQGVGDPGTQAGMPPHVSAGVEQDVAPGMQWKPGDHGADHGQIVDAGGNMGEQLADGHPGLSVAFEAPGAPLPGSLPVSRKLAVQLVQLGLGVECIHVRDPARHEAEDDVLHPGGKMRHGRGSGNQPGVGLIGHERRQRQHPESVGCLLEHLAPRQRSAGISRTSLAVPFSHRHGGTSEQIDKLFQIEHGVSHVFPHFFFAQYILFRDAVQGR